MAFAAIAVVAACGDESGDPGPTAVALIDGALLDAGDLVEVQPCRHSHEHELRHVRIFADADAAQLYDACVTGGEDCTELFAPGALFVKYEYDTEGCQDLVSYTVSLKVEDGSYAEGLDWRWQRLDPDFTVIEDGAPPACVACHVNHCSPPHGHDLRCLPD